MSDKTCTVWLTTQTVGTAHRLATVICKILTKLYYRGQRLEVKIVRIVFSSRLSALRPAWE